MIPWIVEIPAGLAERVKDRAIRQGLPAEAVLAGVIRRGLDGPEKVQVDERALERVVRRAVRDELEKRKNIESMNFSAGKPQSRKPAMGQRGPLLGPRRGNAG